MSEDSDNTQKPKVTLIKQPKKKEAHESQDSQTHEQDKAEKRKVVVIKNKTVAAGSGQQNAPTQSSQPTSAESASPSKAVNAAAVPAATAKKAVKVVVRRDGEKSESEDTHARPKTEPIANVKEPVGQSSEAQGVIVKTPIPQGEKPHTTRTEGPSGDREPRPATSPGQTGGYQGQRTGGYQGQRTGGYQGYQGQRPAGSGYQGGGYQGQRPAGTGYQGQRPAGSGYQGGGYQGQRPAGTGYQGTRPAGTGYQGTRPAGTGYQGQRPAGTGYQGQGGYQGGQRPGGYQGGQGGGYRGPPGPRPAGGGYRPGGPRPGAKPGEIPAADKKTISKRFIKAKKPTYTKKDKEEEQSGKLLQSKKKNAALKANPIPKEIDILESISVAELARKMNLKASDLISKLMSMGMMVTINQQIDADTATLLASEYGCEVHIVSLYEETLIETIVDKDEVLLPRSPVVTVMGHVDHGKTKLLDAIRKTSVQESEFGGITQHIGAYQVMTHKGTITFLDTPGHEAFTLMRARGAQVTDIVVLVVAADDGVMPQTVEALNHAKAAKVPIIVAVNKVDKPEADVEKVKRQLGELGLVPEEWGGTTIYNEISALKKTGINELLESILLQSEILELKANYACKAEGKILESKIDHGRGIVSTIIIERGTLHIGDSFVAGIFPGKVRAIYNDKGEKIDEAIPSMPIEVIGFEGMPNAGDPLQVTESEKEARLVGVKRQELKRFEESRSLKKVTLDNLYDTINQGTIQELRVVLKADVQGSAEAVKASLEKLSTKEIRLNVLLAQAGAINENDVNLASASNALIIAFNVRPTPKAKQIADQEKVEIRKYNVIYKAVEEIQQAMEGMLAPEQREELMGTIEVRNTFKVPKIGLIAGAYVLTGRVKRNAAVHVIRNGIELFSGKISSLRRFKDDAKEVETGYECGIGIEGFTDLQVGDQLEVFEVIQIKRTLSDTKQEDVRTKA